MVNSPNLYVQLAHKFGLAKVPQTLEELMAALSQIMPPAELELVKYMFMQPEQFQAANVFGSPDLPSPTEKGPAKDNAPALVTNPAVVTPATGGATGGTEDPPPVVVAPKAPAAVSGVNPTNYNKNVVPGEVGGKTIYYDKSFEAAPMDVVATRKAQGLANPGGYSGEGAPAPKPISPVILPTTK